MRIFLLSPANCNGRRAQQVLSPNAQFPLAEELRSRRGARLGDLFSFVSGLYFKGKLAGSGMALWEARRLHAEGKIDYPELIEIVAASAPSTGHCNTMGTALSMNSLAEALGMKVIYQFNKQIL